MALAITLPVKQAFHSLYEEVCFFLSLITLLMNNCSHLCDHAMYVYLHNLLLSYIYLQCNLIYFQGIFMAPVWDSSKRQFVGMLSAVDFILILQEVCGE